MIPRTEDLVRDMKVAALRIVSLRFVQTNPHPGLDGATAARPSPECCSPTRLAHKALLGALPLTASQGRLPSRTRGWPSELEVGWQGDESFLGETVEDDGP